MPIRLIDWTDLAQSYLEAEQPSNTRKKYTLDGLCLAITVQQRPRQRGYNIAGPPALRTSVLSFDPKATPLYARQPTMRIARKRQPVRSFLVCHAGMLTTALRLDSRGPAETTQSDGLFDSYGLGEIARLVDIGP